MAHVPVLLDAVLSYLDVRPDQDYLDATVGGGGYTEAILKRNAPRGRVLGVDWDETAIERARRQIGGGAEVRSNRRPEPFDEPPAQKGEARPQGGRRQRSGPSTLSKRLIFACGNFRDIETIARAHSFKNAAGAVFDLGLSSDLIERSGRGFSYQRDEPLIMSYQLPVESYQKTARDIVNSYTIDELAGIFQEYGQERRAGKIAQAVVEQRRKKRIETTSELVEAIERVSRSVKTKARIFQALRIETNQEIDNLNHGLAGAWRLLGESGRLVVVTFHSLEDKIVKDFFRDQSAAGEGEILTKKPVGPSEDEIRRNRRARSAKLRAIWKL